MQLLGPAAVQAPNEAPESKATIKELHANLCTKKLHTITDNKTRHFSLVWEGVWPDSAKRARERAEAPQPPSCANLARQSAILLHHLRRCTVP